MCPVKKITLAFILATFIPVQSIPRKQFDDVLNSSALLNVENTLSALKAPQIDNIRDHVHFQLYTKAKKDGVPFKLNLHGIKRTTFDIEKPVKILVHGFLGQFRDGWMSTAKEALLSVDDVNVILVGWTNITQILLYPWVVEQSYEVAKYLGELIDFLVGCGSSLKHIHVIGHSIGAHIAGVASKAATSGIIGRITGLDAAYPLYKWVSNADKLDMTDADFVDCIHTSSGLLGEPLPVCDADFYPNGGTIYQPGCDPLTLAICSHRRSHDYFVESIHPSHRFKALTCSSYLLTLMDCVDIGAIMGYYSSGRHKGVFYVPTNSIPLYSRPNRT